MTDSDFESMACPTQGTPYLYKDIGASRTRIIIKANCGMWNCEYCYHLNRNKHYNRIMNGASKLQDKGQQLNFITLTSHEKLKSKGQCLYVWRRSWRKLSDRLRRAHKKNSEYRMAYVWVVETHKNGRLHWHGIINGDVPARWLKDHARACGMGYEDTSEEVWDDISGLRYIVKYLNKSNLGQTYPSKMRRIAYSQSFPDKPKIATDSEWEILPTKESLINAINIGLKIKRYEVEFLGQMITSVSEHKVDYMA